MAIELTPGVAEALLTAKQYKDSHQREFPPEFYPWQRDYFAGHEPQKMLLAGNQTGKTMSTGYEFACHVTGDYPDWWRGPEVRQALNTLAAGVDGEQLKEVVQRALFGEVDENRRFTGGWIHPGEIEDIEWSGTITGLARRVKVKSRYGTSRVTLRQYTQSRTGSGSLSFAGTIIDLVWVDECPPDSLVGQLVTRTINGMQRNGGWLRYSMTPELGMTELVTQFMENLKSGQSLHGPVPWSDCPHLTPAVQDLILAGIPAHEHDMRRLGTPFFGAGLIYPVPEERIKIEPFNYAEYDWCKVLRAIDLGVRHPQATAWLLWDPEPDIVYLVRDYAAKGQSAAIHAAATNALWSHSPVIVPHDFDTVEKGTATAVSRYYRDAGLTYTVPFENPGGGNKVEPGIQALYDRMVEGRFKAFSGCRDFFREMRLYHRDEHGRRVTENDDVLDAVRYAAQMVVAKGVPLKATFGQPDYSELNRAAI